MNRCSGAAGTAPMAFIVSGGSQTPGHIRMNPEATPVDRV